MGNDQNNNINRSLQEDDSSFMDSLERSKSSVEEITAEVAETARNLEVPVKTELIDIFLHVVGMWRTWCWFKTRKNTLILPMGHSGHGAFPLEIRE